MDAWLADAEVLGLAETDKARIAALGDAPEAEPEAGLVEIWPENWDAVLAFAAVQTQWRDVILPSGKLFVRGLDYVGVRAGLELAQIAVTPALWAQLQDMEVAGRDELNR